VGLHLQDVGQKQHNSNTSFSLRNQPGTCWNPNYITLKTDGSKASKNDVSKALNPRQFLCVMFQVGSQLNQVKLPYFLFFFKHLRHEKKCVFFAVFSYPSESQQRCQLRGSSFAWMRNTNMKIKHT